MRVERRIYDTEDTRTCDFTTFDVIPGIPATDFNDIKD